MRARERPTLNARARTVRARELAMQIRFQWIWIHWIILWIRGRAPRAIESGPAIMPRAPRAGRIELEWTKFPNLKVGRGKVT